MLLSFSSLSFLGFGVTPPTPDWGLMIATNRSIMAVAPWATLWPLAALTSLIIGINLTADAARQSRWLGSLPGRTRMSANQQTTVDQRTLLLQIEGLSIGYRNQRGATAQVLRGINLAVARGETIGIVGESGSGKSTLALAMLGYLRAGSRVLGGNLRYAGQDLFQSAPSALQALRGGKIALIPQNAGQWLTPTMRIGQQIAEALQLHTRLAARDVQQRAHQLLVQVHLPQPDQLLHRYPHQLSGGQQQRVAIAMALAGEPDLLVLDEPTTGLDVTTQAHILTLLREVSQATAVAMVYVSHDLTVIARVSDRVAVMYAGEIAEMGATQTVLMQPNHPYTRGLLRSIPRLQAQGLPTGLPGTPPAIGSVTVGCAFAPRCGFADQICHEVSPMLEGIGPDAPPHQVRCHHWSLVRATPNPIAAGPGRTTHAQPSATPLLNLQAVQISYHRPGFLSSWFKQQSASPATVSDLSLQIQKGETLALVGESGSGKSTITRAIAGLLAPRAGEIRLDGSPLPPLVDQRLPTQRRRIQMIFQNPDASLNPRHTVAQILAQPLRLYFHLDQRAIQVRSIELLQQVRLGEQYLARFPAQLSGGEQQRVAIARAFAAEPDLILCDEVVSALDVSVQATVLALLSQLQAERGVAYLFIAHDLAVVRAIADRVAVLYQGTLCEIGTTQQVYAPPYHPYTELLLQAALIQFAGKPTSTPGQRQAPTGRGCPAQAICPQHLGALCAETVSPWQETTPGHFIRCHIPVAELL